MSYIKLNSKNFFIPQKNFLISKEDITKIKFFEKLVIEKGDKGINEIEKSINGYCVKNFLTTEKEFIKCEREISDELKKAIIKAYTNIKKFHQEQFKTTIQPIETTKGIQLWTEFRPIDTVGLYVPGGTAPLFSSLMMQAIPAIIAGCKNIIICTPPDIKGNINPVILYVAKLLGIKNVYKVGGAQAIFAMAYGTNTIKKCLKIYGPGNKYVTEAKKIISEHTAIDMPAGPSEVMVILENENIVDIAISDSLSQLEHDPNSRAFLVSTNKNILEKGQHIFDKEYKKLNRKNILETSKNNMYFVKANNREDVIKFINTNAPEHLILLDDDSTSYINKVINAGSVFCGAFSPESFGDYASGSNHILPTSGYAKTFSGLSVESFGKRITFQKSSYDGFNNLKETVKELSLAEGLDGHFNAIKIRERLIGDKKSTRTAFLIRKTKETEIIIDLNIDGTGNSNINTGINYFDHMLEQLSKHGNFDLSVQCIGDLEIDEHHTIEDVSITLGKAFKNAIKKRTDLERYSSSEIVVMDETKASTSIDISTRMYLKMKYPKLREYIGDFPSEMFEHFFQSFVDNLSFTCHIEVTGVNSHHIIEATFKSFARALNRSLQVSNNSMNSTKGIL